MPLGCGCDPPDAVFEDCPLHGWSDEKLAETLEQWREGLRQIRVVLSWSRAERRKRGERRSADVLRTLEQKAQAGVTATERIIAHRAHPIRANA